MKKILLLLLFLSTGIIAMAQTGIAVNTTGADPDNSAMLDVASTERGMLVPRMTSVNRNAIASPAAGLLVYDTDSLAFYYNDGGWNRVANQHQLGSSTDYAKFEDDGTLVFYGNSTTFDDLQVPGVSTANKENPPTLTSFAGNNLLYAFSDANESQEEQVYFTVQIPHGWKEGSTIYPHVHFSATTAGGGNSVTWGLEYTWTNVNTVFSSTTSTATKTETVSSTARTHQIAGFGGITPDAGTQDKISSTLVCRLYRNSSAGTDTFTGDVFLIAFDVHYEVNTNGSRAEWVK